MDALQKPSLESQDSIPAEEKNFKIVVIGDGAVGKTALCQVYVNGKFPEGYTPTVFESFPREIKNGDQVKSVTIWDTAGQEGYDHVRKLMYPNTDLFLVLFCLNKRASFENVREEWIKRDLKSTPSLDNTARYLIGTMKDLCGDEKKALADNHPTTNEINKLVKDFHFKGFMEVSAKTDPESVKRAFEEAARLGGLWGPVPQDQEPKSCCSLI